MHQENQTPDAVFIEKACTLRPFYFIVVVWGERYTDLLLNFCIASLLSPNNIPALLNSGNKFLIATTDEDWGRMQMRPTFQLLKQYVETVFLRIPPCPSAELRCIHMGIGHKLATHRAYEDRAYGVVLVPDQIVSDGSLAAVQRYAVDGYQVVLAAWLRFGEEPLFKHLKQMGVAPLDSGVGDMARPLVATGRQLVSAGIRSFHSQTLTYEWESPYFEPWAAVWWRVPDEDGVIVHSLNWAPMLIDYDAVEHHDASTMDNWTIDGDYVYRNFGLNGKVHVVQDSDELMLVSWSPLADGAQPLTPKRKFTVPIIGKWWKGLTLYETLTNQDPVRPIFDSLKQQIFMQPVYWHARDISQEKWSAIEEEALAITSKYRLHKGLSILAVLLIILLIKSVVRIKNATIHYKWAVIRPCYHSYDYCLRLQRHIVYIIKVFTRRVGLVLIGNRVALRWWWWRLRKLWSDFVRRRPFLEPRPPVP